MQLKLSVIGIVLFLMAQSCILLSGFVMFAMIGQINRKLPDNQQISYLNGNVIKTVQVFSEYRRLYPEGRLHTLTKSFFGLGIVLLIIFAWRFG
jgi:hypothetical protein